jgi:hypothetical protein
MARTDKLSAVKVTKARGRRCCMTAASAIRVFRADDHIVRAVGVSLNHTDGPPPIERMTPPSMIADFEAHDVVGEDRMWRLQSDVIRPISLAVIVRLRSLSTCNGRNGAVTPEELRASVGRMRVWGLQRPAASWTTTVMSI